MSGAAPQTSTPTNPPPHQQQFCVRWNSYQSNLQNAFPKLLTSEHFVDVTLACENEMIKCHKVVLSACSTYFEKLLVQNPCQHPIIFMKDMRFAEMQALVDFMYKGEVNVTQDELPSLLKSAEALQIRGLCGSDQLLNSQYLGLQNTQQQQQQQQTPQREHKPTKLKFQANGASNTPTTNGDTKKVPDTTNGLIENIKKEPQSQPIENGRLDSIKREDFSSGGSVGPDGGSSPDRSIKEDPYDNDESYYDGELEMDTDYLEQDDESEAGPSNIPKTPEYAMANVSCQYSDNSGGGLPSSAQRRIRRSEAELRSAAECITRGQTFQTVSDQFNIPISTIRFYMARKGILPRRKRGRACSAPGGPMMSPQVGLGGGGGSSMSLGGMGHGTPLSSGGGGGFHSAPGNTSPVGPPYHLVHYKLPALGAKLKPRETDETQSM